MSLLENQRNFLLKNLEIEKQNENINTKMRGKVEEFHLIMVPKYFCKRENKFQNKGRFKEFQNIHTPGI